MAGDIIFYQFSRSKIEQCDFGHFLGLYAPDNLPTGKRLQEMMGTMMFGVEGYDHDPREIHSIPEVRRFHAAFHQAWPYWLYNGCQKSFPDGADGCGFVGLIHEGAQSGAKPVAQLRLGARDEVPEPVGLEPQP